MLRLKAEGETKDNEKEENMIFYSYCNVMYNVLYSCVYSKEVNGIREDVRSSLPAGLKCTLCNFEKCE